MTRTEKRDDLLRVLEGAFNSLAESEGEEDLFVMIAHGVPAEGGAMVHYAAFAHGDEEVVAAAVISLLERHERVLESVASHFSRQAIEQFMASLESPSDPSKMN